jgi:hypothetical protein
VRAFPGFAKGTKYGNGENAKKGKRNKADAAGEKE